jgi:hypothetical protein
MRANPAAHRIIPMWGRQGAPPVFLRRPIAVPGTAELSLIRKIISWPARYKSLYGKTLILQIINVLFLTSFQNSLIVPNKRPILLKETGFRSRRDDCCIAQQEVWNVGLLTTGLR